MVKDLKFVEGTTIITIEQLDYYRQLEKSIENKEVVKHSVYFSSSTKKWINTSVYEFLTENEAAKELQEEVDKRLEYICRLEEKIDKITKLSPRQFKRWIKNGGRTSHL